VQGVGSRPTGAVPGPLQNTDLPDFPIDLDIQPADVAIYRFIWISLFTDSYLSTGSYDLFPNIEDSQK